MQTLRNSFSHYGIGIRDSFRLTFHGKDKKAVALVMKLSSSADCSEDLTKSHQIRPVAAWILTARLVQASRINLTQGSHLILFNYHTYITVYNFDFNSMLCFRFFAIRSSVRTSVNWMSNLIALVAPELFIFPSLRTLPFPVPALATMMASVTVRRFQFLIRLFLRFSGVHRFLSQEKPSTICEDSNIDD